MTNWFDKQRYAYYLGKMAKITPAIRIEGSQFKDKYGRTLMLRGVNLSGSSKIPWSAGKITAADFYRHQDVSFVNRPFPLDEAAEHFSRLRYWGLTFLRLIVTWEAIEHAGPGQYDEAYLDYLRARWQKEVYPIGAPVPFETFWNAASAGS